MKHGQQLPLERCPHCNVAKPSINQKIPPILTGDHAGANTRAWVIYACATCGGAVLACSPLNANSQISHLWPAPAEVAETVPTRAREFLTQAISSLSAPAGAERLSASAVDAMLKDKGYKEGSLNSRIDSASKDHLITAEMAAWAHEIRLEANDQRHADESAALPDATDAQKVIEFATALAQLLYVLPARVEGGRKS